MTTTLSPNLLDTALGLSFLENDKVNLSFLIKLGEKNLSLPKGQGVSYKEDSLYQSHSAI